MLFHPKIYLYLNISLGPGRLMRRKRDLVGEQQGQSAETTSPLQVAEAFPIP